MKIGIINVQWFDNPGAVLLCYSLQQYLKKIGYDSIVIDYAKGGASVKQENKHTVSDKLNSLYLKFTKLRRYNGVPFFKELRLRHEKYELFRKEYLNRTERFTNQSADLFGNCDAYIVGSDVVWKPAIVTSEDAYVYFLQFAKKEDATLISFAASIGTADEQLLQEISGQYRELLKDFDYISVREKSTENFLENILHRDIITLLDPVFLLKGEDYKRLLNLTETEGKYIYFYVLEKNTEAIEFAKRMSDQTGLKIIYDLHSNDLRYLKREFGKRGTAAISDGPKEFLERILNASYIVTNSFHGTAFSILFKKDFFTFSCVNKNSNVSIRMENLLEKFELMNRYNVKSIDLIKETINFEQIENVIDLEREKSKSFLQNSIKFK